MSLRDAVRLGSLLMLQQNFTQANVTDTCPRLWTFKESHASGVAFGPFHVLRLRVLLLLSNFKQTASLSPCGPWSSGTMSILRATRDIPHSSRRLGHGSLDASWCPRRRLRLSCSLHIVSTGTFHRSCSLPHLSRGRQSENP